MTALLTGIRYDVCMNRINIIIALLALLLAAALACVKYAPQASAARDGMVVSEQNDASAAGLAILRAGGNAIDAAVAVGYALAVTNPCCGNIGGGGFMTIHLASGKNIFLNFREKAPLRASKNMYLDAQGNIIPGLSTKGYLAVGVPGTVLGLDTALQKYGSMSRMQVMAPAIRLAVQGYIVTAFDAAAFRQYAPDFRQQPSIAKIFLRQGRPLQAGERLVQADLAATLKLIAAKGPDAFYKGPIASAIVNASNAQGGILSLKDFENYRVEELNPLQCQYRGYTIISSPPPSSGGTTLCEMLNILENFSIQQKDFFTPETARVIIEAMRYGFMDRNSRLGDPDFVHNPVAQLTSKDYAARLSSMIRANEVEPYVTDESADRELTDTTHYSVIDRQGNAVAVTFTLNGFFGAKVMADHTGFFLNDEMDDFTSKPGTANNFGLVQYDQNDIQPGKTPLSSMTPTIVMKNHQVYLVLGSPGGPRIITSVMLTLLNVIDRGMSIQEAVTAPRIHYQVLPDYIDVEPLAFTALTRLYLELLGYHFRLRPGWSVVEAIQVDPVTKIDYGANDPRRPDGSALGLKPVSNAEKSKY